MDFANVKAKIHKFVVAVGAKADEFGIEARYDKRESFTILSEGQYQPTRSELNLGLDSPVSNPFLTPLLNWVNYHLPAPRRKVVCKVEFCDDDWVYVHSYLGFRKVGYAIYNYCLKELGHLHVVLISEPNPAWEDFGTVNEITRN